MQKQDEENVPNVERGEWNANDLSEAASNKMSDDITREMLRGDETKGEPDERDIVGSVDSDETWQGREETKKNNKEQFGNG